MSNIQLPVLKVIQKLSAKKHNVPQHIRPGTKVYATGKRGTGTIIVTLSPFGKTKPFEVPEAAVCPA